MQTKHQIRQLLESAGVNADKRLGQHFLIDLNLMQLLVNAASISRNDVVLEVGCGTGSLTEVLAEKAGRVIAVEIDHILAGIAERQIAKTKNVKVINTDILENKNTISNVVADAIKSARKSVRGRFLLVANLPYNVACPVMMNLITGRLAADAMYVTVQKEVAERMTAKPGGKHYGVLSIFLSATGEAKTERVLKPSVFWPAPQVDSAMVGFIRKEEKAGRIGDMEILGEVVNLFMNHRRKMLRSCTKSAHGKLAEIENWPEIFEKCGIDPHNRPGQLRPEDYIAIAKLCREYIEQFNF